MIKQIELKNFGPIREANVTFGDLTVLVGPQASGKSLFVQLVKAIEDAGAIRANLKSYGFDWLGSADPVQDYCFIYFGGGLQAIAQKLELKCNGKSRSFGSIVKPGGRANPTETTFLIPAQRMVVLQDGWPKPFMAYSDGDPYCMRRFSEALRLLMDQGLGSTEAIFPQRRRLKEKLRALLDDAIYVGGELKLDAEGPRKRIVLSPAGAKRSPLPYSAWSAGQREFTPLLLGLYWLMPSSQRPRLDDIATVIIEEPEMGLHPQAILSFGLLVLELLQRGYRVILSTHSPVILDLVWAIRQIRSKPRKPARRALKEVFQLQSLDGPMTRVFDSALEKDLRTHYFERHGNGVAVRDISELDPGDADDAISGWGGLSGFSGHIAETVGSCLSQED